jgi:sulfur carrier protein ThiS
MKVMVRLYGTLSNSFPGYVHSEGIEVTIPDGGKVKDLLSILKIPETQGAMVAMEGRILKPEDLIREDVCINILQPMSGG